MEIVSTEGVRFRTKLLAENRAKGFAACLERNPRFHDVQVHESTRAKNWYQRHYVTFAPASEERQQVMLDRQQASRQERAETEGLAYVFVLDRDSIQPFCWCFNPQSGETYETTLFDCSCPDFRYRCQRVGMQCKHQLALAAAAERGDVKSW